MNASDVISKSSASSRPENQEAWFCLRSQPKHEHVAAAHLRKMEEVEVYLPRIRFKRATRQGIVWVTEALFPNYLFARFNWNNSLRQVQAAFGVRGVVHFGRHWPVISHDSIQELRDAIGTTDQTTISQELAPGDAVHIAEGTLRGLRAVVSQVMPSRDRIAILLDFLGRQTTVEISTSSAVKEGSERAEIIRDPIPPTAGGQP